MTQQQWGQAPTAPQPPQWGPPTAPQPPQWGQAPPPRPPRKRSSTAMIVTVVLASVFGLILLAGVLAVVTEDQPTTKSAAQTTQAAVADEPAATEPLAPTYPEPKVSDFTLKVKILEKQNFGSAGSNIVYRIVAGWEPTYDPDKTYELTYEVRGGEDGPAINTMEITGDEYRTDEEEIISTASVGQRLTVKAVSVEEI